MALYPSLEDMKVDQLIKAQLESQYTDILSNQQCHLTNTIAPSAPRLSALMNEACAKYPSLNDYMGLEFTPDFIAANMPEYLESSNNMQLSTRDSFAVESANALGALVAPVSGQSLGLYKAHVTNGIREVKLRKGANGKIGLKVQPVNNGIFVNLVTKSTPAATAGLRFGDQILEINGKSVAGFTMDAVHELIKKSPNNDMITFVIRDRPFERTVTLHKDSTGHVGFNFKDGKVIGLVIDSSAAKNGLLTDHNLLEVNGQNVIGLKDKEITKIILEGGDIITITIVPSFIYQHMTKRMSSNLLKNLMDHSIPTL